MVFMSIPMYLNPIQMVGIELDWEISSFIVSGVGMIAFSSGIRAISPLGVLKILLWYVLFSSWGWKCVRLEGCPLELSSTDEVSR